MSVLSDVLESRLGDSLPYIGFALVLISVALGLLLAGRQENSVTRGLNNCSP